MIRTLSKISPEEQAREAAIQSMNPKLRKLYEEISAKFEKQNAASVWFYYEVGLTAKKAHANAPEYGDGAIEKLAMATTVDRGLIYKAITLTNFATKDELKKILERRTVKGEPVSWSHLAQIMSVEDKKQFHQMVDTILEKNLSIRQLRDEMKKRAYGGGGSRQLVPRTAMGGLAHMIALCGRANAKFLTEFDETVFNPLEAVEGREVTDGMLQRVGEAEDTLVKLAAEAQAKAADMTRLRGELVQRRDQALAEKGKQAKVSDPDDSDDSDEPEEKAESSEVKKGANRRRGGSPPPKPAPAAKRPVSVKGRTRRPVGA